MVSLISQDGSGWDVDFLKQIIAAEEYEAILAIHIGNPTFWDRLIWPPHKNGIYSC